MGNSIVRLGLYTKLSLHIIQLATGAVDAPIRFQWTKFKQEPDGEVILDLSLDEMHTSIDVEFYRKQIIKDLLYFAKDAASFRLPGRFRADAGSFLKAPQKSVKFWVDGLLADDKVHAYSEEVTLEEIAYLVKIIADPKNIEKLSLSDDFKKRYIGVPADPFVAGKVELLEKQIEELRLERTVSRDNLKEAYEKTLLEMNERYAKDIEALENELDSIRA